MIYRRKGLLLPTRCEAYDVMTLLCVFGDFKVVSFIADAAGPPDCYISRVLALMCLFCNSNSFAARLVVVLHFDN